MSAFRTSLLLAAVCAAALLSGACKSERPGSNLTAASAATAAAPVASAAGPLKSCAECEAASPCAELSAGCSKFSGDEAARCNAVKDCVQRTGCAQGDKTFTSCYCGELGTAQCLETPFADAAMTGACKEPIAAAYGAVKNNTEVLTRYIETDYPGGAALARLNCLKLNCQRECSFDKLDAQRPGPAVPQ